MNQSDQWPSRNAFAWGVMMGDDLQDVGGEVPLLSECAPRLAMTESHDRPFRLVKRYLFSAGEFERRRKLSREGDAVDHEAQVMQQTRRVCLFSICGRKLLAELPADHRAAQGMSPKSSGVKNPFIPGKRLSHAASEKDRFHPPQPESHDRPADGLRRLRQSEQRRAGDAKTLRRDRIVVGNQTHNFVYSGIVRGHSEQVQQW